MGVKPIIFIIGLYQTDYTLVDRLYFLQHTHSSEGVPVGVGLEVGGEAGHLTPEGGQGHAPPQGGKPHPP